MFSYKNIDNLSWMREQQENEDRIKSILNQAPNYDVSVIDEELGSIQPKTLLVFGDQDDSIPLDEIARTKRALPSSWLWIVPNTGHSAHKDKNKDAFVNLSKEFLNGHWSQ